MQGDNAERQGEGFSLPGYEVPHAWLQGEKP